MLCYHDSFAYCLLSSLEVVMDSLVREVDYHDFCTVHGVDDQASEDNLLAVYAGLYSLMKCALRHSSLSIKQVCTVLMKLLF